MNTPDVTVMYEWDRTDWQSLERCVFKLQKRIYQASRRGDESGVHRLQKLLIRSRSAVFLAVKRVTQDNKGKDTAGIDGAASLDDQQKMSLALRLLDAPLVSTAQPVRRVWIPKPGKDEKRPLGIPVMEDRARQALAKLALEPEWEAKFEPNSYGFRPGRSCHDAIEAIFLCLAQAPKYVLDADIAKCFDHIDHTALLDKLGTFPEMRRAIKAWLKAGVLDGKQLFSTEEGTPQGGVISPLLANVALHGLEQFVADAFQKHKVLPDGRRARWTPRVIRYADDFVVIHRDLEVIKRCQEIIAQWLKGMGLEMKPSKTKIVHTLETTEHKPGFDFLGFNVRHYRRGKGRGMRIGTGDRLDCMPNVRPSVESQRRLQQKIGEITRRRRSSPAAALVGAINPVLRGWGNYFSTVVSKQIFHKMDHLVFWKLWPWAVRRHANKSKAWIHDTYWVRMGSARVFTADGAKLMKLGRLPIERHVKVIEARSPYDGDAIYWSARLGKHPELKHRYSYLLRQQKGYCPGCGLFFKQGDQLQLIRDERAKAAGTSKYLAVVHEHCQTTTTTEVCMTTHRSVEEPDDGKPSSPVLKPSANSDVRT